MKNLRVPFVMPALDDPDLAIRGREYRGRNVPVRVIFILKPSHLGQAEGDGCFTCAEKIGTKGHRICQKGTGMRLRCILRHRESKC